MARRTALPTRPENLKRAITREMFEATEDLVSGNIQSAEDSFKRCRKMAKTLNKMRKADRDFMAEQMGRF